jgi:putative salt-induced outer membrane protein YdiY
MTTSNKSLAVNPNLKPALSRDCSLFTLSGLRSQVSGFKFQVFGLRSRSVLNVECFSFSFITGLCLAMAAVPAFGAEPIGSLQPVVTTNFVVVTNLVVVTNYVPVPKDDAAPTAVAIPKTAAYSILLALSPTNTGLPALSWVPPEDSYDWIQLNTGDWLKGRIKAMQDRQIEFFSEKIGDLSFDWKDIRQLRSPRTIDVLFVDGKKISGSVAVTPDQVSVGGPAPCVLPRNQLQSLTPGGAKERDYWSGDVSLGLTLQSGNTKSVQYNAQIGLQRRTPATRISLDYIGNISSVNDQENANNTRVNGEFDYWLSQRFYLVLPSAEYYQDPFQNLAHRLTVGVGVGYDIIDQSKLEWNITTAPAYQYAWFDSAEPGEPTQKGTAALTFGSRFKWDITRHIKWITEYRGQYTSREVGETTHHGVSTLSVDLNKRLTLDVSGIWDRISNPKTGLSGTPQPDDFRLVVSLGVHF